jgi:hypothetical protein
MPYKACPGHSGVTRPTENSPAFVEPEGSSRRSESSATGPCPEPFSPVGINTAVLTRFTLLSSSLRLGLSSQLVTYKCTNQIFSFMEQNSS